MPGSLSTAVAPVSPGPPQANLHRGCTLRATRESAFVLWLHPGVVVRDTEGLLLLSVICSPSGIKKGSEEPLVNWEFAELTVEITG